MDDVGPGELHRQFGSLVRSLEGDLRQVEEAETRPAILIERLASLEGAVPIGTRARFLMTTYVEGELVAYGWRTDLRVTSGIESVVPGLAEPGVGLADESAYYGGENVGVQTGISRVWVETLVRVPATEPAPESPDAWLASVLRNPNEAHVEPLHPVARRHHLLGSRVVHDLGDGRFEQDLRAVTPPLMSKDGNLVVGVVEECQWYRWNKRSYEVTDRVVGHLPIEEVWVE